MIKLIQERSYYAQQIIHINAIKRLQHKFSTLDGYMYCVGDENKYKRKLIEVNLEMEEFYENRVDRCRLT